MNRYCIPKCWVYSEDIAFDDGVLTITLPEDSSYTNGRRIVLHLNQNIPAETTINALVVIAIGDGAVTYPLINCRGQQVTAAMMRQQYRYPVHVVTTPTGGSFVVDGGLCCAPVANLPALTGDVPDTTPDAPAEGGAA